MKHPSAPLCCLLAALCLSVPAGEVVLPPAPPSAHFDTESVTNAPLLRPMMDRARIFRASVSLWATSSNNVKLAFGKSRNDDGVLLPGDESLAFGWENGAWFLASPTFKLRIREDGSPVSLSVGDDDVPDPFSDVTAAPPDWLFSRDWDVVRLTVRGTDERDESLSVRLDTDSGVLILR